MYEILEKLSTVAASLDEKGKLSEANIVDTVINKLAEEMSTDERAEVEKYLAPAKEVLPQPTPEQLAAHRKRKEEAARQKALEDKIKLEQRQLQEFQGLAPRSMPAASTESFQLEEVHTVRPEDTPLPPRAKPLPSPKASFETTAQTKGMSYYQQDQRRGTRGIVRYVDENSTIHWLPEKPVVGRSFQEVQNNLKAEVEKQLPEGAVIDWNGGVSQPWHPESVFPFDTMGNKVA